MHVLDRERPPTRAPAPDATRSGGAPGWSSSGRSTRSPGLSRSRARTACSRRERLVPAEQLQALEQPGRDLRPVTATRIGWNAFARLQLQPFGQARSAGSIGSAVERLDARRGVARRASTGAAAVEQRRAG